MRKILQTIEMTLRIMRLVCERSNGTARFTLCNENKNINYKKNYLKYIFTHIYIWFVIVSIKNTKYSSECNFIDGTDRNARGNACF